MVALHDGRERLPEWLRRPPRSAREVTTLKSLLRTARLNTVCEEARCPNIAECFNQGTATFMILGDICTRGCRFCAVHTGKPNLSPTEFRAEGLRVAEAAQQLGLKHVVVTSVARDDLTDGGASGFVETIRALRDLLPEATVEVLVPDFRGDEKSILAVVEARPDVFNHNLETVPRLYRKVRPGASYQRSLNLLSLVKANDPTVLVKSGIMLGLGEATDEVQQLMQNAKSHGVDIFTAGQYMQPSLSHLPVERYLSPDEFEAYELFARTVCFREVFIGPLVRSSYHAGEFAPKQAAAAV